MKTDRPSVLLVDDVATFRETIRLELEDRGYEIQEAGDAREAVVVVVRGGGGGGGGVLFAGRPSGSSTSRSFSRGFLGVCVSLSRLQNYLWRPISDTI